MSIIESIPNISEGRRPEVIEAAGGRGPCDRRACGCSTTPPTPAHNRSVFTLAGDADALKAATIALFEQALAAIDLRSTRASTRGSAPSTWSPSCRSRGSTMAECVALATDVAATVAERFGLPVYLYEEASANPARQEPRGHPARRVRRAGGEDGARTDGRPTSAPRRPTRPPAPRSSARACRSSPTTSTCSTDRLDVAKKIAAAIRQSSGGLRYVKAMGIALEDRGIVQVSMNLTNYEKTPIFRVFELVKREAERYGVNDARERNRRTGAGGGADRRRRSTTCRSNGSGAEQMLENKLRGD